MSFLGVSCGIPDFRSRDGLYASLKNKGEYELDDPQQMSAPVTQVFFLASGWRKYRFDITYFKENPSGKVVFHFSEDYLKDRISVVRTVF